MLSKIILCFVQFKCKKFLDLRAFLGVQFGFKILLRVKSLTFCNSGWWEVASDKNHLSPAIFQLLLSSQKNLHRLAVASNNRDFLKATDNLGTTTLKRQKLSGDKPLQETKNFQEIKTFGGGGAGGCSFFIFASRCAASVCRTWSEQKDLKLWKLDIFSNLFLCLCF